MLPDFVAQVRALTLNSYTPALAQFFALGTAPNAALLTQLSNATGVSTQKWQGNLNLTPAFYQTQLLPGVLIGRYDARVSAPFGSVLAGDGDPSLTFVNASFVMAMGSYLTNDLQYTKPSTYAASSNAIQAWNFAHDGLALPDVIPDLAAAIALNPKLQILAANGYHDLATPFFQTELDLARMGGNPNVSTTFYRGGHMTYLDDRSRPLEKADVVQLIQRIPATP